MSPTTPPAHSAPPIVRREDPGPALLPAEVLERVRARDPEALGAFYDRYVDQVFGLVLRLLGDRSLAEDVTSEVFLKVHRAADRLDPARDPAPWLTTIATNACRDLWRSGAHRMRRKSDSIEDTDGLADRLAGGGESPEQAAVTAERERAVQQALAELPEHLRLAIVLHDYEGLDHLEVAKLTGIEHAAARKRYSRALEKLGRRLKDLLR